MGLSEFFQETPDFLARTTESFTNAIPVLILIMILIGIIYWLRELQKGRHTEVKVYRRP